MVVAKVADDAVEGIDIRIAERVPGRAPGELHPRGRRIGKAEPDGGVAVIGGERGLNLAGRGLVGHLDRG